MTTIGVVRGQNVNEYKWNPIMLEFIYYMHNNVNVFYKYWTDDGPSRSEHVAIDSN